MKFADRPQALAEPRTRITMQIERPRFDPAIKRISPAIDGGACSIKNHIAIRIKFEMRDLHLIHIQCPPTQSGGRRMPGAGEIARQKTRTPRPSGMAAMARERRGHHGMHKLAHVAAQDGDLSHQRG